MLALCQLSQQQVQEVYQNHLITDFVPEEQKPLEVILRLMEQNRYICYGLFEEDAMTGYAFFAGNGDSDYILIDYFAICKGNRSKGYGSKFIKLIKQELSMYHGIIFEVESGKSAKDEEELSNCQRRLAFYHRCGLKKTNVKVNLFGVDMVVLYLPINDRPSDQRIYDKLNRIYDVLFGEKLHKQQVVTSFEM